MGSVGVLLQREDKQVEQLAKGNGLSVQISPEPSVPFDLTLIVGPGRGVPWHLVKAGFAALERWEAAAPLEVGLLAADIGTAADRERTEAVIRDLRVPLYACDLLFVRRCPSTEQLIEVWRTECGEGKDSRLAFLRALYHVKPLFLALPRSWLADATVVVQQPRNVGKLTKLVNVEIAPGRYVCCKPDEVDLWKARTLAAMGPKRRTSDAC